ncbi:hypothetical protein M5K25_027508 [Dendrobium thyrsiflorum]|uniref:Uncharacterized protein n=1 Tax=Dendrobium thyrsiflorum TaxID=117978 RepID=A0ABD0TTZ0_DENTH
MHVSQGESSPSSFSLCPSSRESCVKTPVSAWVFCLHRGVVKKEERFSAGGRAVLCRRKSGAVLCRRKSGSLPSPRSGEKGVVLCRHQGVKAFGANSASDSSETAAEEEVTNLCLMADNLDHSDQEEVSDLTYDELFEVSERIHSAYRKLKRMHARLSVEHLNLQKEFEILRKDHALIDDTHMKLLDEFDELKKKCDELEKLNNEMERDGKILIDENIHREHLLNIEIMGLKHDNAYFERKWKESEENRKNPALTNFSGTPYTPSKEDSRLKNEKNSFLEVLKKKIALVSKDQVLCLLQEEEKEVSKIVL